MEEPLSGGLEPALARWLVEAGLASAETAIDAVPLTGGVASDIWRVTADGRSFAVKRALGRLRVARTWEAPVSRSGSEVAWLEEAARVVPDAVPRVLAVAPQANAFAMDFLDPATHPVWKAELRVGRADPAFAALVGRTIAAVHDATAGRADVAARFSNDAVFHAIRLEPYLEATAEAHPSVAPLLRTLSAETLARHVALVHGDVSPKNILVGPKGPVLLDAECAWYGDPAFDLAFCLNHLLLKCLWNPAARDGYLVSFDALTESYLAAIRHEARDALEMRAARLLPGLFLARVDGKSPVEYVTAEADKARVRRTALPMIAAPPLRLSTIRQEWSEELSA